MDVKKLLCEQTKNFYFSECYLHSTSEIHSHLAQADVVGAEPMPTVKILAEYSKEDFLRRLWVDLFRKNAPLDIFSEDFSNVSVKEHEIIISALTSNVSYQASVGYDHAEPYSDYETYREREPYVDTEEYYNSTTQSRETRMVTKYRDVEKQRLVTKSRIVTDWKPFAGELPLTSVAIAENAERQDFDAVAFVRSLSEAADSSFSSETSAENTTLLVTTERQLKSNHSEVIRGLLYKSLPGDHASDLALGKIREESVKAVLYKVPEYEATICFGGKTIRCRAFPFGFMRPMGDAFLDYEHKSEFEEEKERVLGESSKRCSQREQKAEKSVCNFSKKSVVASILFLLSSIILSCFVRNSTVQLVAFFIAVAIFIMTKIAEKTVESLSTKKANTENDKDYEQSRKEAENFEEKYKLKQRTLLDNKLKSLNLQDITPDEVEKLDEQDMVDDLNEDALGRSILDEDEDEYENLLSDSDEL